MQFDEHLKHLVSIQSIEQLRDGSWMVTTKIEELQQLLYYMREHMRFVSLVDVYAIEDELQSGHFQLCYLIKNLENNRLLTIKARVGRKEPIPSACNIWLNCFAKEHEIAELMNLPFEFDAPNVLQPKTFQNKKLPSSRTDISLSNFLTRNNLQMSCETEDGLITKMFYERGFLYMGYEKYFESLEINQVLGLISKINFRRSSTWEILWCGVIEKAFQLEVPDRAKAVRMVLLEMERIIDHFFMIEALANEIDFRMLEKTMQLLRKRVQKIKESYSGSKSFGITNCVGGVRHDLPRGWISNTMDGLEEVGKVFFDTVGNFEHSSIWKERLNTGSIASRLTLEYGVSGPTLRASGVNYDLRKNDPYYFYSDVDLDIPIGQRGTVLDRFLVRREEIRQSLRIIGQVLDNVPTGNILTGDFNYYRNADPDSHDFNPDLYIKTAGSQPTLEVGDYYNFLEGPNGWQGVYLQVKKDKTIGRIRIISPDHSALDLSAKAMQGNSMDEAGLIFGSFNIHMSEVEK